MTNTSSAPNPTPQQQPLLVIIDGHSLAFRSYFAFAKGRDGGLRTANGTPTNICFGFLKSLLQVMQAEHPQMLAVAFDLQEPTFRHKADATYKADRPEAPEDFAPDMKNLQRLLAALNLPVLTATGYEADDVLATLTKQGSEAGCRVKIASGDRDLFQLVDDGKKVSVLYFDKNAIRGSNIAGITEFDEEAVVQKLGIKPEQVVDYKALCGDKSDNIPGVRGIGEKTAVKLLIEYPTLGDIYQNIEKIKGANRKKLETGKDDAEKSQYLAQLRFDVPLNASLEACELKGFDAANVKPILEELELKQFLRQIDRIQEQFGGKETENSNITVEVADESLWFFSAEDTEKAEQAAQSLIEPQVIDTPEKLQELVQRLQQHTNFNNPVAWDTETTALDPFDAELVGLGCCWGDEVTDIAYIPVGHEEGTQLSKERVLNALRPILESEDYPKAFQNTKFDRLILRHQGINLSGVVFDTMLASYVLHPEQSHNLGDLSLRYLEGIESKSYKDLEIPKGKTIAYLPIPKAADYCGMDAYATFLLVEKLRAELASYPDLNNLLLEIEQPLEPALAEMEYRGIRIDIPYLNKLSQQLEKDLNKIEAQAYEDAGEEFNLGSPKQLSELLFEKLKLSRKKSRKIKTGYSTDHATLEKLQGDHPVIDRILEYRTLSKLKSTYVDAIPALTRPDTQRIHTNFNQTVTTTGRLSSSNPNLQNIPIRTEFSRQIRKAFLPKPGWQLIAADYSQIELRILAHLSQEPVLVEAYRNRQDVHTVTAQLLFEKETVTPDERRLGKTINFGVIYGMGAQRFAREAGVSSAEGKAFIDKYRDRYAKVFEYLESMKKTAIAQGYVTTLLERRRYFYFASSLKHELGKNPDSIDLEKFKKIGQGDSQLLRAAANAPIQGSSADIIKIATIKLHNLLQNYQTRLLLQVHDELVFEVPPDECEELTGKIQSIMEEAVSLSVPLVVEVRSGNNWMEAK
ncbi:DNA polymerase I [Lusitaniella coriacea LEGE 07157]|uniref:DNA polymerase I n=1 Tax=Lusitaniella coriacea LEGE 07157 TaxID=945747 RepID=A0A8J7JD29_9CYAN|nr:DNA polymerase I [Lusitaniella coriacea]MBE9118090.1 DNA polymerase I [Lusitaniella coriacea LEGE 07157]